MAKRFFDGAFDFEREICVYPMRLHGKGASVLLHEHRFPHLAWFWPGDNLERIQAAMTAIDEMGANDYTLANLRTEIARQAPKYRVFAIKTDGTEVELELGPYKFAWIGANVKHRIELVEGDEGRMACTFARHGADGKYRIDPTASPLPYVETQEG